MLRTVFICTVFLLVLVECKHQAVPFSPIHPGSIHADHFSPLSGSGVLVDIWEAETFNANLLDFSSLTSFTPVTFDIAGGISFNNNNFKNDNIGPISINSETNNLNIEALYGGINFNSYGTTTIATYGTDINIESFRDSIAILAHNDLQYTAPGISLAGNYENGIQLTAARLSFTSGFLSGSGHFDFTGEDIYFRGDDEINISAFTSLTLDALHLLAINSDGDMDYVVEGNILLRSLSGPSEFDGASVNTRSEDFYAIASGANTFASVLGEIQLLAAPITISSAQQVKFSAVDSIIATAVDDILFDGADSVQLFGDVLFSPSMFSFSSDLAVDSVKDKVTIFAHDDLTLTGNTLKTTATDSSFTGQQLYQVSSTTITLDSTHRSVYEAGNLLSLDGKNGKILVDASDDLYINSDDYVSFSAPVVDFSVTDDAYFEFGADLTLTSTNQLSFAWQTTAVFRGENRLHMNSERELLMTSTSLSMTSADNTFINAFNTILVSTNGAGGDVSVEAPYLNYFESQNSLSYKTTNGYTVTSSGEIDILSEISTNFHSNANIFFTSAHNTDISGSSLSHTATGNFEFTADDELQITTQDLLAFSSDSFTSFEADTWFRLEAGDFLASGEDITLTSDDVHIFTRKTGLFRSQFGPITVGVDGDIDFLSSGELSVDAKNKLTVDGVNVLWEATDYYQGDVSFTSRLDDFTLSSTGASTLRGDRFESFSSTGISFTAVDDFTIKQITADDANDFGNIIFTSNGTTFHDSSELEFNGRDWDLSADNSLIVDCDFDLTFTTVDNTGNSFLGSTYGTVSFNARDATFNSETTDLNSEFSTTITSLSTLIQTAEFSNTVDLTSQFNGKSINTAVTGDYTAVVEESTTITGGTSVTFNTGDFVMQSSGGGGTYTAASLTRFQVISGFIEADAGEDISFIAETSTISFTSTANDVISQGGAHFATSTLSTLFTSDTLTASTLDNGFISIDSDFSIVHDVTGAFSFEGTTTPIETFGRSGLIETTGVDGHICIVTNSPSAPIIDGGGGGEPVLNRLANNQFQVASAVTSFNGESVLFTASGPNAELIMDAQGGIVATAVNSVNIHAYGFIPSDPQFLLEDQTFGVLFRTASSPIHFTSAGDYTVYSAEDLLIFSEDGTLSSENGNEMDFRTFQENADIIVRTREGDILTEVRTDAFYNSGTPYLPADTLVNATRNIGLTATLGSIYWNQLGTSTDPNKLGIQLDSYGLIDIFAEADLVVDAEDGGIINIETRQGNMNFKSTTNDITQTAETGTIYWQGRGSATFTTPFYDIEASGDGGSIYLHSGADNKFTVQATNTKLFFEAVNGEIDVLGTEAIVADIDMDFLVDALTTTIEGGSVYFDSQTDIDFTSDWDSQLGFSATVEFTVDSIVSIDFSALKEIVMKAGGGIDQAGISMTATLGDITYENNNGDTDLKAVNIALTSVETTNFHAEDNVNIYSTLDSFEEDNILIQSQTTSISFTAGGGSFRSGTLSQKTTSGDFTLNAEDVVFAGSRETRYTILDSFDHTLTDTFDIEGGNIHIAAAANFLLETTLGIEFTADSYLNLNVAATTDFAAETLNHDVYGVGSIIDLETTTGALGIVATGNFGTAAGSLLDFDSAAFSLLTTDLTFRVGTDFHQKTIDNYILNAATFTESSGRSEILDILGKFTLTTLTTDISTIIFDMNSLHDLTLTTTTTTLTTANNQPMTYYGENEIRLTTGTFLATTLNDILIQNNYLNGDILFNHATITENTGKQVVSGENTVVYQAADDIFLNIDNLSFSGSGVDGVQFFADTDFTFSAVATTFNADGGNFHVFSTEAAVPFLLTTGGALTFTSHAAFGDIQLLTPSNIVYTTKVVNFQQYSGASTRGGDGYISFVASGALTLAPRTSLTFDSEDNVVIQSESITLTGPTTAISSSSLDLFQAGKTITVTAGAFTAETLDSPAVAADESKIQIKTNVATIASSSSSVSYTASDEFETISEVLLITAGTVFEIDTVSPLRFAAELGGINLSFGSGTFTAQSDVNFNAVGNAGRIDVNAPTVNFRTTNFLYEAQGSIWTPFTSWTTGTVNLNSGHDISLRSDVSVTVDANTALTTRSRLDGRVQVNSANTLAFRGQADMRIRAEGMLGNTDGRYVLEDSYWQSSGIEQENNDALQKERINRNTMGIEFISVNGDLTANVGGDVVMVANYGSIEFRAQLVIRYLVPNNGAIRFFGIPPNNPPTGGTSGLLQSWPYNRETDYCFDYTVVPNGFAATIDCTSLSTVLNEIVLALMNYGLLTCVANTGWCPLVV